MEYSRKKVIDLAASWIGLKESDGSYKKIIDIYNSYKGALPRGTKMQYGWAWCACTWSALAIKLGYTEIMPIEISCSELIKIAQKMGIWIENDAYIPRPGDAVLYDWDDNGVGDNTGNPDHIGIVESVNRDDGYFIVIEGNYQDAVKRRTVSINGRYIRGFIVPKYTSESDKKVTADNKETKKDVHAIAHEVIAGKWGNGETRKEKLKNAGYKYEEVQSIVNDILNGGVCKTCKNGDLSQTVKKTVKATTQASKYDVKKIGNYKTTVNLYCRDGIGTNKKALCLIPKGTIVKCYGYYGETASKTEWLYVTAVLDGVEYIGFSCSGKYLKKL